MNIALDYDCTYTRDTKLWCDFVDLATISGHKVYIVTARPDDNDNLDIETSRVVKVLKTPVIYCGYKPKRVYCSKVEGIKFDIWLDDSPEAIVDASLDVKSFSYLIAHGDEEHKQWLNDAAVCYLNNQPLPPPRGKGTDNLLKENNDE